MARTARLVIPGLAHLVRLQAHEGVQPLPGEADRQRLVADLREVAAQCRIPICAYALLPHAVWWLAVPPDATALGLLTQGVGRRYVAWHNRRHGRRGTLWSGRFHACAVEAGAHLTFAMQWLEGQALAAGEAIEAPDAGWSSLGHHLGWRRDAWLAEPAEWWALGNTPFEREQAWRAALAQGVSPAEARRLAAAVQQNRAYGGREFLAALARTVGRALTPQPRGRPRRRADDMSPIKLTGDA
ncbi:MAG: transposase [Proteobacteria bacterium]|nr:transposase [Pseudomonadota bacterium]